MEKLHCLDRRSVEDKIDALMNKVKLLKYMIGLLCIFFYLNKLFDLHRVCMHFLSSIILCH